MNKIKDRQNLGTKASCEQIVKFADACETTLAGKDNTTEAKRRKIGEKSSNFLIILNGKYSKKAVKNKMETPGLSKQNSTSDN